MNTRLEIIDINLNNIIKNYTSEEQRKAVQALVAYVIDNIKIKEVIFWDCIDYIRKQKTIPNDLLEQFRVLVENLDDEYLTISDKFEGGSVSKADVAKAFSVARGVNALFWATNTNSYVALAEMIYEISVGYNNLDEIRKMVIHSIP